MVEYAWSDHKAVSGGLTSAAVESDLGTFVAADIKVTGHLGQMFGADDRAHVDRLAAVGRPDRHCLCALAEFFDQGFRDVPHGHGDATGHASARPGATECRELDRR